MFQPPETFSQLRALLWAAPMVCAFFVTFTVWLQGGESSAWMVGLATALAIWLLAMAAVWVSSYGVRHSMLTAGTMFLVFCVPLSVALIPAVAPLPQHGHSPTLMAVGGQALLLVLAALLHARRAPVAPGEKRLTWPGCHIDVERRTIAKLDAANTAVSPRLVPPALIGAASVGLYHALKAALPAETLPVVALVVANAMSLWLTTGPIARAWGQSLQLRRLERAGDRRFTSARLPWLEQERARSPVGRLARRVMPTRT